MGKERYLSMSDEELLIRTWQLRNLAEGVLDTDESIMTPEERRAIKEELAETQPIIEELQRRGYGK